MKILAREDTVSTILKLDKGLEDVLQLAIYHCHSTFAIANHCQEREYCSSP
jgi:hypothetical protein